MICYASLALFGQHSKTFDILHAFLLATIAELSTLKQVRFFWPTLYIQPFCCNSLLKCLLQSKIMKNSTKPFFEGLRSFKVINVNQFKKPVTSACYDMRQVCIYLQPFSHYKGQLQQNNIFLDGVPLFDALIQEEPPHSWAQNFCHNKLDSLRQPTVKIS